MDISPLSIIEFNVTFCGGEIEVGDWTKIQSGCMIGHRVKIRDHVILYRGVVVGDDCVIGPFVHVEPGVVIGDRSKIKSFAFLCEGVTLEEEVFVGHGVQCCNEKFPKAWRPSRWELREESKIKVGRGAVIGNGAVILPGVSVGRDAIVGAGAVIVDDVPDGGVVISPKAVPVNERHGDWGDFL